jgi:hypothetical protein
MLTIQRLGRRSFEVFRHGTPVGIARFMRDVRLWSFRPYPTPHQSSGMTERHDAVLRNLLCHQGERCTVARQIDARH